MGIHVLCPHCGTEFEITDPSMTDHIDINNMPTDGTFFLIPKGTTASGIDIGNLLQNLSNAKLASDGNIIIPQGDNNMTIIDNTSSLDDVFAEFDDMHDIESSTDLDDIETNIINDGYIPNNNLWRRWIMAQMLRHYRGVAGQSGFDDYFVTGKPFAYSWQTATDEIKTLSKLSGNELILRERFFNMTVINEMAADYEKRFWRYFKKLPLRHDKGYNRRNPHENKETTKKHTYVHIPRFGNIYLADDAALSKSTDMTQATLKNIISEAVDQIANAKNYKSLYAAMTNFMSTCPMSIGIMKSHAWKNAFKGSGAYYTMDNMIKFHNCKWFIIEDGIKTPLSANKSLQMLEQTTNEFDGNYYKLYAVMCEFIKDNNFDFEDRLKELGIN